MEDRTNFAEAFLNAADWRADASSDRGLTRPTTGIAGCCARRERPRSRAAEQRDELAPPHSITSSARSRIDVGSVTPIALAVFRLSANSKFVACSTGRSAGCAPRRILAT